MDFTANTAASQALNGHKNGHVKPQTRAQSEPYFVDITDTISVKCALEDDHRAILTKESALSDEAITARGYFTTDDPTVLGHIGFPSKLGRCLIFRTYNHRREPAGWVARPDIPIKGQKYVLVKGASPVVDIAPLTQEHINDPTKEAIVTEGAKKADSAATKGYCSINLNGVWGFRGANAKGGIANLPDWDNIPFKGKAPDGTLFGRVVYVIYDSDIVYKAGVESALRRLIPLLIARGAIVKVVYLNPGPNGEKTGLDDFFARGGTVPELFSLARDLEPVEESKRKQKEAKRKAKLDDLQASGLPIIETNDRQLIDKLKDFAAALSAFNGEHPTLFHGTAGLVEIGRDKDGEPVLQGVTRDRVSGIATVAAKWISTTEREGVKNITPPRDLCDQFLANPSHWQNIPPIDRVATAPFFDAQGNLCDRPGYHASTRVWLHLPENCQIPDTAPTAANVKAAQRLIRDTLLGEVAFANEASRAHAIALMLLPTVMPIMRREDTPLHLFDSPQQSSGKTTAAKICIAPTCEAVPSADKKNNEENRKELFAKLLSGPTNVFIDNVKSSLNDPTLATAITSPYLEGRIMGVSQIGRVSTRVVWVATSNNAQLDRDAVSRCVVSRIDTNTENPESCEYSRNPLQYIATNRGEVIGAILTLVRHWQAQGSPEKSGKCRSRFKRWEKIMGGILEANGFPGFLDNIKDARDNLDPDTDAWRAFVEAWYAERGTRYSTAAELLSIAQKCDEMNGILDGNDAKPTRFGRLLLDKRDKVFGSLKIVRAAEKSNKGVKWRLLELNPLEKSDDSDVSDDSSYHTRKVENSDIDAESDTNNRKSDVSQESRGHVTNVTIVTFDPITGEEVFKV